MNDLKTKFKENLLLVKEDHPLLPLAEQVDMAVAWTIDWATCQAYRIGGQRKDAHAEAVNKAFFG